MWIPPDVFKLSNELAQHGLAPRFEAGDLVARGFADLGFEEFQVLPGEKLLSLTAGNVVQLPEEHKNFFFWIPSVDETVELLEKAGVRNLEVTRIDQRSWRIKIEYNGAVFECSAATIHKALLLALLELQKISIQTIAQTAA